MTRNPMVAIIFGAVLLAEKFTGVFVVGFVTVVVGVLLVNSDIKPPLPVVDPERFYRSGEK